LIVKHGFRVKGAKLEAIGRKSEDKRGKAIKN